MGEVVVVEAVRTAVGRRDGSLSSVHPLDLLGTVQRELFARSGVDPADVGQVVGGCVHQVGAQAMNVTRTAWLSAGLPIEVPASTVDSACGSSQQAATLAYGLVAGGVVDVAVACGVEVMSRVPLGSSIPRDPAVGKPVNRSYRNRFEYTTQFEAAERLAAKWGITRDDCDALGKSSQDRAARAVEGGHFVSQIVPVTVPGAADDPADAAPVELRRDECLRPTTPEGLARLEPVLGPGAVHTAGNSSQIADGAAAVLLMSQARATALGRAPLATVVDACLVGSDPEVMLEGPIAVTRRLLGRRGLTAADVDVVEINEAFAAVVLAWARALGVAEEDMDRVNPNGGAIALGHPLGGTGVLLLTKAVHELARIEGEHALVTMCCGGGLGTGTLLRRAA